MKVLIIGVTGMLGYSLFKNMADIIDIDVYGTVRNIEGKEHYFNDLEDRLIKNVEAGDLATLEAAINRVNPDVVINCIGLIKQHSVSKEHISAIEINSLLPHQIAKLCTDYNCKLIHFSTDCIFDGKKGLYTENDTPDARDLYGKSKCLGEVDYGNHLTLRTSIIGHELNSSVSLIDWFLSQKNTVKGFSKAVFSGLPTCVIARLLVKNILPAENLTGLYQLSSEPIDKFNLLKLVSEVYGKKIEIIRSTALEIDRSLNSEKLRNALHLEIPSWKNLISEMYEDFDKRYGEYR